MLKYAIQTGKMNEMMELLFRVLDLRITFFDLQQCEVNEFNIKKMSPYCRQCRRDPEFNALCINCDREHLSIAKRTGNVHIYHCHAGLLEGIVPLYDHNHIYLGAIVFGQLRDRNREYPGTSKTEERLLSKSRKTSLPEMHDIGVLLKFLSEYISENEIIRYCNKPWAERLEDYISEHLNERITLSGLAAMIDRSTSFLSHNFPLEFGMPLKEYVCKKRMDRAKELLGDGCSVKETAMQLGYYDEFYFSKEFKRYFGQSPSLFKR